MKNQIFILLIALAIGAFYFALDSASHSLQKEVNPPQYDKNLSIRYGAFSKIAYCPSNLVHNWTCKDCKTYNQIQDLKIIHEEKRDIFGYAFYDTVLQKIILVWRGSIDFKNYVNDFSYQKIPYTCKNCELHLGFYQAYRTVASDVYYVIQGLVKKYPNAKITVTGHSLGAALATISAIEINKKMTKLVTQIHTFGCPRIGNKYLAEYIKEQFDTLFRVIHSHDMFTHLPEQEQNYHHYPFEVLYDQNMTNYEVCDDTGEDPSCSNSYSPNYNKPDHNFYFFHMDDSNC